MYALARSWQGRLAFISHWLLVTCAFALPFSTSMADLTFPLAAVLSFFSAKWQDQTFKILYFPVAITLVVFFLLYVIGIAYTIAPSHAVIHRLLQMVCLFLSALLMASITNDRLRKHMLNAFLLAMVITLILSYGKYYIIRTPYHTRFDEGSVFKDHIIQSFLMVIALFIFVYRWLNKYRYHWVYAVLTILTTYNILFISSGRSGYFIFAALLIYTGMTYFGWRGMLSTIIITILLGGSAYWISDEFRTRIISIEQNTIEYAQGKHYTSIGIRIQSVKNAYHLFMQKPWIGHGTGSFSTVYAALPIKDISDAGLVPLSYNNYLNVGVELGIIGMGFLIFMFALQWRYSFYLTGEWRYLMQILLISMILGCLANPWLSDTTELHFYALFLAVGFSTLVRPLSLSARSNTNPSRHQSPRSVSNQACT